MIAPTNIHPPKNWQDFETLCLKLWGEIWQIPHEIEFNSDNAQGQHGVDIYGPIDGGISFNGVQCKNKKLNLIDGSPNRITISDIDAEIKKALNFKPALKKTCYCHITAKGSEDRGTCAYQKCRTRQTEPVHDTDLLLGVFRAQTARVP